MNPLHGNGYAFWSGLGNDLPVYLFGVLPLWIAWWRRHNCHVHRCPRLVWHDHPDHGHPVCRKHFPDTHVHPHLKGRSR